MGSEQDFLDMNRQAKYAAYGALKFNLERLEWKCDIEAIKAYAAAVDAAVNAIHTIDDVTELYQLKAEKRREQEDKEQGKDSSA